MADLLPVAFHGEMLYLVEHNGEPFAPVKPICDALGLDWAAQHAKIISTGQRWNSCQITAISADGKRREMVCMPLRKLSGWLAGISAAKVKPENRDKLIAYQNEGDNDLWRHWTTVRPRIPDAPSAAPAPVAPRQNAGEFTEWISRDGGQFMTPARMYAIQAARLLAHLVNESEYACPAAAAALYHAARAVAVDTLNRIETAEREANHA
jgi:hypothetical protein